MKKKLLFINGRPAPPLNMGGDMITTHTLLTLLQEKGFEVCAIGAINSYYYTNTFKTAIKILNEYSIKYTYDKKNKQLEYYYPYKTKIIDLNDFEKVLKEETSDSSNLTILTQLDYSYAVVPFALMKGIPVIFYIHDALRSNLRVLDTLKEKQSKLHLLFNSKYTYRKYKKYTKLANSNVLYSPIIKSKYEVSRRLPKFITIINPVEVKGGRIFLEIAKKLENQKFLAVKGWYDPIKDGIDLSSQKNIEVWERQIDMRKVFKVSKLLLVPSLWEEAFGRIAAEALTAGVPVLASKNAGLIESLGSGGLFVNEYKSSDMWVKKIQNILSNKKLLIESSLYGKKYSKRFDANIITDKLVKVIENISRNK